MKFYSLLFLALVPTFGWANTNELQNPIETGIDLTQKKLKPIIAATTPFTAEYNVDYGSIGLGKAKYDFPAPEGNTYTFKFKSSLSFLLLSDKRKVVSEFTIEDNKLTPFRFLHHRKGTGPDYREQAAFIRSENIVHTRYKDEKAKIEYDNDLLDPLMTQLQIRIDLQNNRKELTYKMVEENQVENYKFKILGQEVMKLESGSYDTIKLEVVRKSKKRHTYFWMAPDLGYLPIRLSHFEKGDKQLDMTLRSYKFLALEQQTALAK
ncbi:DUF3108 domain-containing protein [Shewanella gelidii]|uniref:DUF3108 domain-containing protein n=1 Tax=Shewanella gelidii TaxID=1642821 RepID=A0A917JU66_9GAMM|nr:DUF3108 domain-containing protein [Shewanella gelidii]MCL1098601.1 DUF3108 domain-containing protein [Shewanella gelidii]GGI86746.1 hypothetical protein GCM10009332_25100 [Shewanella gelidii]